MTALFLTFKFMEGLNCVLYNRVGLEVAQKTFSLVSSKVLILLIIWPFISVYFMNEKIKIKVYRCAKFEVPSMYI